MNRYSVDLIAPDGKKVTTLDVAAEDEEEAIVLALLRGRRLVLWQGPVGPVLLGDVSWASDVTAVIQPPREDKEARNA